VSLSGKQPVDLGDIQQTLFVPVTARAAETRRRHPALRDPKAVQIDALMFVKGIGWHFGGRRSGVWGGVLTGLLLGCGQDRDGPLRVERASSY
jgi:hypothetical protein